MAAALDQRWTQTAAAFAAGQVNLAQTRVIAEALEALPADLGEDLLAKAESLLVTEAAKLGPRELKVFGSQSAGVPRPRHRRGGRVPAGSSPPSAAPRPRPSSSSAPAATAPPTSTPGSPTTSPTGSAPTSTATPHRATNASARSTSCPCRGAAARRSAPSWRTCPPPACPARAAPPPPSRSPSTCKTLLADLGTAGVAVTSTGDKITADQARRLACQAEIMPFVMSGKSVIHDQGRAKRLFEDALRIALNLLYPECTAVGCSIPASWCEAHHKVPWSKGGKTRLQDGTLLCPFHHHRAHDPAWNTTYHPDGDTTFTRRQ